MGDVPGGGVVRERRGEEPTLTAESRAAEAEHRFERLLESSPHAVIVLAVADAVVLAANRAAQEAFAGGGELEGHAFTALLGRESAVSVRRRLDAVDAAGAPRLALKESIWPGRGPVPTELRYAPVRWRGERAVMVTIRDMTDLVTAEHQAAQLIAVEQRFRQAFDDAAIGMVLVAVGPEPPAGTFLEANTAMCELLGRTQDELTSLTFADVTHPDDVAAGFSAMRAVLAGELPRAVVEKRYVRADGEVVWARVTTSAVRDEPGHRPAPDLPGRGHHGTQEG